MFIIDRAITILWMLLPTTGSVFDGNIFIYFTNLKQAGLPDYTCLCNQWETHIYLLCRRHAPSPKTVIEILASHMGHVKLQYVVLFLASPWSVEDILLMV